MPIKDPAKRKEYLAQRYLRTREEVLARSREYYKSNAEAIKARSRKWYADNRDDAIQYRRQRRVTHAAMINASSAASRAKKPEYYKQKAKEYRQRNLEKIKKQVKLTTAAWNKRNKERRAATNHEYYLAHREEYQARFREAYARKMNAPGKHTAQEVRDIWIEQGRKCAVPNCTYPISDQKGKNRYHVDHIRALARGGRNDKSNLQILCAQHNWEKNDRDEHEWAVEHGVLLS